MTDMEEKVVLYILMRSDLGSLNPGKAMAQASHVGVHLAENYRDTHLYKTWLKQAGNIDFGVTIVLAIDDMFEMCGIHYMAKKLDMICATIHDPTYPIVDGDVIHQIPLTTCMYILTTSDCMEKMILLRDLELYN